MSNFERIPQELQALKQWCCWRLEDRPGADKPTKTPYNPKTGYKISVTDPRGWVSFEEACAAGPWLTEIVPMLGEKELATNFHGIGLVFTASDPYGFIDLDDTHGDVEAYQRQLDVFTKFDSYSELSPSGNGLHIIVKGNIPSGRRRSWIEVYSNERYATFTGNVYSDKPIADRDELLNILWAEMGGAAKTYDFTTDGPETKSDLEIYNIAKDAVNGEKFLDLWGGDWAKHYNGDQSRADFALVDILAFYSDNRAQIRRLFLMSQLGQREKATKHRNYIDYMLNRCFDQKLPPVDIEGLKAQWVAQLAQPAPVYELGLKHGGGPVLNTAGGLSGGPVPGDTGPRAFTNASEAQAVAEKALAVPKKFVNIGDEFPPGLLGEIAEFIYEAAPTPVRTIALAGAIGLMSGICGRAYNTMTGTGLNHYIMLIAKTGTGKESIANGISKLMESIKTAAPASMDFIGPGSIRSDAGLIKWLAQKPCFLSVVGEIGLRLQQMSHPNASSHEVGLKALLLDLYNKSGKNNVLNPMAYADSQKNTTPIVAPAFSMLGESTPERFYGALNEDMITEGLLPRFTTIEYHGKAPYLNEDAGKVMPRFDLSQKLATLAAQCLGLAHQNQVIIVGQDDEARALLRKFSRDCTDRKNDAVSNELGRELWNRAHIKAVKLASICAVGVNPWAPMINATQAQWAMNMVVAEVGNMLGRFENGDIGAANQSENKQMKELIRIVKDFIADPSTAEKYGSTFEQQRDGVFTNDYLSRRLAAVSAFRLDNHGGATVAIKRCVQLLLDNDDIREVPKEQMLKHYGKRARAFVISNPARFNG